MNMRPIGFNKFAPAVVPVTLNPADKAANITLSSGNLVATKIGNNQWVSVRATRGFSAGAYYFEATNLVALTGDQYCAVGFANASMLLQGSENWPGYDANSCGSVNSTGQLHTNELVLGSIGATFTAAGDIVAAAINRTTGLWWMRKVFPVATNWNNNASANPATGVGGVGNMPAGKLFACLGVFGAAAPASSCRLNAGSSAFAGAVPAGFSPYDLVPL
jgi:hypothetical protein